MTTRAAKPSSAAKDVMVTPSIATEWLERNTRNRKVRVSLAYQYADDMRNGRWEYNGDPIRFDKDGVLLDGQHRLLAIVDSGTTQKFHVIEGLEPHVQVTIDQGGKRSPSDQLTIRGIETNSTLAAAARIYVRWDTGRFFGDVKKNHITTPEIVEWVEGFPSLYGRLIDLSTRGYKAIPCAPAITLAVALRLHQIDEDDATEFFGLLRTGANLEAGSPILTLRERLFKFKAEKVNITQRDMIAFFVVAWNAYREGRSITKLQRPNGASWNAQNFPVPR